jgi:hypothetical protein
MSKDPVPDVNIDGIPFPARRNLRDFLEQARLDDDIGLLWIDAICINQKDNEKKSAQVERMGDMYSKATEVHACLERDVRKLISYSMFNRSLGTGGTPKKYRTTMMKLTDLHTMRTCFAISIRTKLAQYVKRAILMMIC